MAIFSRILLIFCSFNGLAPFWRGNEALENQLAFGKTERGEKVFEFTDTSLHPTTTCPLAFA